MILFLARLIKMEDKVGIVKCGECGKEVLVELSNCAIITLTCADCKNKTEDKVKTEKWVILKNDDWFDRTVKSWDKLSHRIPNDRTIFVMADGRGWFWYYGEGNLIRFSSNDFLFGDAPRVGQEMEFSDIEGKWDKYKYAGYLPNYESPFVTSLGFKYKYMRHPQVKKEITLESLQQEIDELRKQIGEGK